MDQKYITSLSTVIWDREAEGRWGPKSKKYYKIAILVKRKSERSKVLKKLTLMDKFGV